MKRLIPLFLIFIAAANPDPKLTPGETLPAPAALCKAGYSKTVRHTSQSLKSRVLEAYGVSKEERKGLVLDHLISLEIGGADTFKNLWPEDKIEARRKDFVENWLHRQVCSGKMDLKTAQYKVIHNWKEIYERQHRK